MADRCDLAALPEAAEAHGLVALILYTESRRPARLSADGTLVPLRAQDPALRHAKTLSDAG
ncbi:MAG: DUF6596 domain-containing protein [Pseudomonadota bacterium]